MPEQPYYASGALDLQRHAAILVSREPVVVEIRRALGRKNYVAVMAGRGTGRTTLVRLVSRAMQEGFRMAKPCDCSMFTGLDSAAVFADLAWRCYQAVDGERIGADSPSPEKDPIVNGLRFQYYIHCLNDHLLSRDQPTCVIVLDELQAIEAKVCHTLLANLRAFQQSTAPEERRILFYLTGMLDLVEASAGQASHFVASEIEPAYFSKGEVRQVMLGGAAADFAVEEDAIGYLFEQTCGHPQILQTIASYAFRRMSDEGQTSLSKKHVAAGVEEAFAGGASILSSITFDLRRLVTSQEVIGFSYMDVLNALTGREKITRQIRFDATLPAVKWLKLIGVIGKDAQGNCAFTSPIIARIAQNL